MTTPSGIVLLGSDCVATNMIYHAMAREWPDVQVILEPRLPKTTIFRRRLKSLGIARALGQVPFRLAVVPWLVWRAKARLDDILRVYQLDGSPIPVVAARVPSVNSPEARAALRKLSPRVVAVSGTRIIGRETLSSISAPFINMHGGITPSYRGVHGGYWALYEGQPELVGSTVHYVDEGIDTGAIIEQVTFQPTPDDSFATYPYLHTAFGIPPLIDAVRRTAAGAPPAKRVIHLPSKLRSHPTAVQYLRARAQRGVR